MFTACVSSPFITTVKWVSLLQVSVLLSLRGYSSFIPQSKVRGVSLRLETCPGVFHLLPYGSWDSLQPSPGSLNQVRRCLGRTLSPRSSKTLSLKSSKHRINKETGLRYPEVDFTKKSPKVSPLMLALLFIIYIQHDAITHLINWSWPLGPVLPMCDL